MTKDKKVEFRVNEELTNKINTLCNKYHMNKSELIRYAIENMDTMKGNNAASMAKRVFDISIIVNSMYECGTTKEKTDLLLREADSLWQYLN